MHELAQGLQALGYKLAPSEVAALAEQVHPGAKQNGTVDKSAFLASQLDWNTFMSDHRCPASLSNSAVLEWAFSQYFSSTLKSHGVQVHQQGQLQAALGGVGSVSMT